MLPTKKKKIFPFNYYNLAIHVVTLAKTLSTNYWNSNVQDFTIESRKRLFHFDLYPTCIEVHI